MKVERPDELDVLLRNLYRSGLCRVKRRVSTGQSPQRIAIQSFARQKKLDDTHWLELPAQAGKAQLPGR